MTTYLYISFLLGATIVTLSILFLRKKLKLDKKNLGIIWFCDLGWISFGLIGVLFITLQFISNQNIKNQTIRLLNVNNMSKSLLEHLELSISEVEQQIKPLKEIDFQSTVKEEINDIIKTNFMSLGRRAGVDNLKEITGNIKNRKDLLNYSLLISTFLSREKLEYLSFEEDSTTYYPYLSKDPLLAKMQFHEWPKRKLKENINLGRMFSMNIKTINEARLHLNQEIRTYNDNLNFDSNLASSLMPLYIYLLGMGFGFRFVKLIISYNPIKTNFPGPITKPQNEEKNFLKFSNEIPLKEKENKDAQMVDLKDEKLTIREISEKLNISKGKIYRKIKKGEIPAKKIKGIYRVNKNDIPNDIVKKNNGIKQ